MWGAFSLICVLFGLFVAVTGRCTLVEGGYSYSTGSLSGCHYIYSIEFCPRHRYTHLKEQLNSVTFELRSNMTKVGFVSTCVHGNKVFSSIVRHDFRKAVTATRTLNMTTMEATFRASMLYTVADGLNTTLSTMQFSLHNNYESAPYDPLTISFQTDLDTGVVSVVTPPHDNTDLREIVQLENPSHHVVSEKATSDHTKCDFNKLLSGQWNFDANNRTWHWKTHTCDAELITVDAFVNWCKKYELKSILFIGSSRTRTLVYDLLLFFGYTLEEVKPDKVHYHLTYHVKDKLGYDLTLHLHWLDNRRDRTNDNKIYSYDHNLLELKTHFEEINICTHPSTVHYNMPGNSNFKHYGGNVDYTSPAYTSQSYANFTQPYAVFFTMGFYEAWTTGLDAFKALAPDVVRFAYESCMGVIPSTIPTITPVSILTNTSSTSVDIAPNTANKNLFFVRLEEAVDPSNAMFVVLSEINDHMLRTIVPELNSQLRAHNMPIIPVLDSYHISRGWKLWYTDDDDIHFYAREDVLYGGHVSHTMANILLQQLVHTMDEKLQQGDVSSASVAPSSSEPHHMHRHSAFPSYNALPEYYYDAMVPLEGRLLMNPHNKREMYLVHGGLKCPIPNWDAFVALNMEIRFMLFPSKEDFDAMPTGASLPNVD